ncbi:Protein phosphatase 2C family protein [Trifolium repens]|nr:Protein phosphatase 2C family protein [Trifolium repens]
MLSRICMKKPDVLGNDDTRAWFTELERHHMGQFSMAAYQANSIMEDYSQVEVGDNCLFVGIYDGHDGTNAAKFISHHILEELSWLIRENNNVMSEKLLREAVAATEEKFTDVVIDNKDTNPGLMLTGSCCLITLIYKGTLYTANLGDSRAVLGKDTFPVDKYQLEAQPITRDHNCEDVYKTIGSLIVKFPDDPTILWKDENGWKVRGLSKDTDTIGDVYIKRSLTYLPKYKNVSLPTCVSDLSSKPIINSRVIRCFDKFLILASRGFWKIMTNEEAVSIVGRCFRRAGIAKILLKKALEKVAAKEKISYKDIVCSSDRKKFHDDMTIIVVFLDLDRNDKPVWKKNVQKLSFKAPSHT